MNEFIPNSFQIKRGYRFEYLSQMSGTPLNAKIWLFGKRLAENAWQPFHFSDSKIYRIKKEETVQKAINELVDLGLIGKQSRIGLPERIFLISDPKKG